MFEIGTWYQFRMWTPAPDGGAVSKFTAKIISVSMPLITCQEAPFLVCHDDDVGEKGQPERIINATSLAFISAERCDDPFDFLAASLEEQIAGGKKK